MVAVAVTAALAVAVTAAALAAAALAAAALAAAVQPTSAGVSAAAIWVAALGRPAHKAASMAPEWLAGPAGPLAVPLIPVLIGWLGASRIITVIAFTIATTIVSGTASCSRPTRTLGTHAITATPTLTGLATTTAALCLTKDGLLTTNDVSAVDVELLLAADPIPRTGRHSRR